MNDFSPRPRAGGPLPATTSDEDTVAVRTRVWCTAVMITVSAFMCLVQTSFAATRYINNPVNAMYVWFIASSLLAFAFPFLLLARDKHPEPVFWICCAVILIFPYDPMLMLMALTSLIARRRGRQRIIRPSSRRRWSGSGGRCATRCARSAPRCGNRPSSSSRIRMSPRAMPRCLRGGRPS